MEKKRFSEGSISIFFRIHANKAFDGFAQLKLIRQPNAEGVAQEPQQFIGTLKRALFTGSIQVMKRIAGVGQSMTLAGSQ